MTQVRRLNRPGDPGHYQVTTDKGVFHIVKEHYAAGPSLFTWRIYDANGNGIVGLHHDYPTKRAALRALEAQ